MYALCKAALQQTRTGYQMRQNQLLINRKTPESATRAPRGLYIILFGSAAIYDCLVFFCWFFSKDASEMSLLDMGGCSRTAEATWRLRSSIHNALLPLRSRSLRRRRNPTGVSRNRRSTRQTDRQTDRPWANQPSARRRRRRITAASSFQRQSHSSWRCLWCASWWARVSV